MTPTKITPAMQKALDLATLSPKRTVYAGGHVTREGKLVKVPVSVLQGLVRRGLAKQVLVPCGIYAVQCF